MPTSSSPAAHPLVSVIIPVYNRAEYLAQAVASVLAQTHPAVEVMVVDDGSTCDVLSSLKASEGVRVFRKENGGQGSARNFGLSRAAGDFVLFLDDDDLLERTAWPRC